MKAVIKKHTGPNPKNTIFNPLTALIHSSGYGYKEICLELAISPKNYYNYFRDPRSLSLERLQQISYMVQKPLPFILNLCLNCNSKSVHWFSEDSLPVDEKLELIKLKGK